MGQLADLLAGELQPPPGSKEFVHIFDSDEISYCETPFPDAIHGWGEYWFESDGEVVGECYSCRKTPQKSVLAAWLAALAP